MGLERTFGDFDARRGNLPTYLLLFEWTFRVDTTTPLVLTVMSPSTTKTTKPNLT